MNLSTTSLTFSESLNTVNETHDVIEIKQDQNNQLVKVVTAPSTFYSRTVAFLFGRNRTIAEALKKDLEDKYGKNIAQFALPKKDYQNIRTYGLNVLKGKNIYDKAAQEYKKLSALSLIEEKNSNKELEWTLKVKEGTKPDSDNFSTTAFLGISRITRK